MIAEEKAEEEAHVKELERAKKQREQEAARLVAEKKPVSSAPKVLRRSSGSTS
jgi:hypothetical protein